MKIISIITALLIVLTLVFGFTYLQKTSKTMYKLNSDSYYIINGDGITIGDKETFIIDCRNKISLMLTCDFEKGKIYNDRYALGFSNPAFCIATLTDSDRYYDDGIYNGVYLNKKLFHDIVKYSRYSVLFKYTATICSVSF